MEEEKSESSPVRSYLGELHMRTADVEELEPTDSGVRDVPLATFVVVVQVYELGRVSQVDSWSLKPM